MYLTVSFRADSKERIVSKPSRKPRNPRRLAATPSNRRLVIRVDLMGAKPPIWRRLEIAPELRLDQVHEVLQAAFDWDNSHLHEFEQRDVELANNPLRQKFLRQLMASMSGGPGAQIPSPDLGPLGSTKTNRRFGMDLDDGWGVPGFVEETESETRFRIGQLLVSPGDKLYYEYDFGDGWEHRLKLEKTIDVEPDAPLARCTAGRRAAPPEDSGGVWTYEWMLVASQDPSDPQYPAAVERMEWAYGTGDFDPDTSFDLEVVDRQVQASVR